MTTRRLFWIVGCWFVATCGSAVFAADPHARLSTYREQVQNRPSGVYEIGEDLYIHVLTPLGKNGAPSRQKMKAVGKAYDLLHQWVLDATKEERSRTVSAPDGLVRLVAVLDHVNPLWRFGDWKVRFAGQEHSGLDKKNLWFAQFVTKSNIVSQIPESLRVPIPKKEMELASARVLLPQLVKSFPARAYAECGTLDLMKDKVAVDAGVKVEYAGVEDRLKVYLAQSEFCKELVRMKNRLAGSETETWLREECRPVEIRQEQTEIATNVVSFGVVRTNCVERRETAAEVVALGMSCGEKVTETQWVDGVCEVVETRTVILSTVRTNVLKRIKTRIAGDARFEDIFLGGVPVERVACMQKERGRKAVEIFKGTSDLPEKWRAVLLALRENPGDKEVWNLCGRLFQMKGDGLGALICFRRSLALDPLYDFALVNAALSYRDLGCPRLAVGYAILAIGLTDDTWCREKALGVLGFDEGEVPNTPQHHKEQLK